MEGPLYFSRPEQAEHVLAAGQGKYVKSFTYWPLRMMLGDVVVGPSAYRWWAARRVRPQGLAGSLLR